MDTIIAAHEGLAVDLPEVEPDAADLIAAEHLEVFELTQERIEASLVELAAHGRLDELAVRRHRRAVATAISEQLVTESTAGGEVA